MRTLTRVGVAVAASSAALLLAPVAHATDTTTTVQLRQELPLTAEGFEQGECPGIAADMDGWHFVLPADGKTKPGFAKLTVTFSPGGTQEITDFSAFPGADGKHAYVASEPGAELTSAVAEVTGGVSEEYLFNLSHTCPAEDGTTPGDDDTTKPTDGSTPTDDTKPTDGATEPSGSDTTSPSASESAAAAPSSAPTAQGTSGDLAETGNGAPVGALSAVAAVLVAAGGFLLFRRRKAQQG